MAERIPDSVLLVLDDVRGDCPPLLAPQEVDTSDAVIFRSASCLHGFCNKPSPHLEESEASKSRAFRLVSNYLSWQKSMIPNSTFLRSPFAFVSLCVQAPRILTRCSGASSYTCWLFFPLRPENIRVQCLLDCRRIASLPSTLAGQTISKFLENIDEVRAETVLLVSTLTTILKLDTSVNSGVATTCHSQTDPPSESTGRASLSPFNF